MCFMLSVELPKWRLKLIFEMRGLRIFEYNIRVEAKRFILRNNLCLWLFFSVPIALLGVCEYFLENVIFFEVLF